MTTITDKGSVSVHLTGLRVLSELSTAFTHAVLYSHPQLGRILTLNEEVQHIEAWAPLYHEPLVHLPAAFIEAPRSALLLGGASFFAAKEVLKYDSIERVLMLERDAELAVLMSRTYDHATAAWSDSRLEVRFVDAFTTLPTITERFDLIINDSIDLLSINGGTIFESMGRMLEPNGVCSDVIYRHIFEREYARRTLQTLRSSLTMAVALIFVPEYPGVLHLLALWGRGQSLTQDLKSTTNLQQLKWATQPLLNECDYFDPRFMAYYLHLPRYVKQVVGDESLTETPA